MAPDIKSCQARGKLITLSLGGADASTSFESDSQAEDFAQQIWDLFLGGQSDTRPFGDAVLDGIDVDIEGGSMTGQVAFVKKVQALAAAAGTTVYLSAAPQVRLPFSTQTRPSFTAYSVLTRTATSARRSTRPRSTPCTCSSTTT